MTLPPAASNRWSRLTGVTLALLGLLFALCAALYREPLVARFDPTPPLAETTRHGIRQARLWFLVPAAGLLGAALVGACCGPLRRRLARPAAARTTLAAAALLAPLVLLEIGTRPFLDPKTSIFMRDADLGWKLRPGAADQWAGVRVEINAKGLRGPEVPYARERSAARILYLGDSVTIGDFVGDPQRTFPYRVEQRLEERLGRDVETVNAGVGGYSPRQELRYLESEGLRYQPDLVVVCFVLNDVLEEAVLSTPDRFNQRYQLRRMTTTTWDRLENHSGLVHAATQLGRRLLQGGELDLDAPGLDGLDLRALIRETDRPDVSRAFDVTLEAVARIVAAARAHDLPIGLVVFPLRVQLADPEASSLPQQRLRRFAEEQHVPWVDLLPVLSHAPAGAQPEDAFVDELHLSEAGHVRVAEALTGFAIEAGRLNRRSP